MWPSIDGNTVVGPTSSISTGLSNQNFAGRVAGGAPAAAPLVGERDRRLCAHDGALGRHRDRRVGRVEVTQAVRHRMILLAARLHDAPGDLAAAGVEGNVEADGDALARRTRPEALPAPGGDQPTCTSG